MSDLIERKFKNSYLQCLSLFMPVYYLLVHWKRVHQGEYLLLCFTVFVLSLSLYLPYLLMHREESTKEKIAWKVQHPPPSITSKHNPHHQEEGEHFFLFLSVCLFCLCNLISARFLQTVLCLHLQMMSMNEHEN